VLLNQLLGGNIQQICPKDKIMFQKFLVKSFHLLSHFATNPEDSEEWRIKKIIAITALILTPLNWIPYALLYFAFNEQLAAFVAIGAIVLNMLIILHYRVFRNYDMTLYLFNFVFMLAITSVHLLLGGFAQSGMVLLFLFIAPIYWIVAYKSKHGLFMFLVVSVIFIIAAILEPRCVKLKGVAFYRPIWQAD
jgi:hypothetical protein